MYYIKNGMSPKWGWMAGLFAFLAAFASLGSADMVQSNTVSQILAKDLNMPTWATGLILAVLVAVVIKCSSDQPAAGFLCVTASSAA